MKVKTTRNKMLGIEEVEEVFSLSLIIFEPFFSMKHEKKKNDNQPKEKPDFHLLQIPDEKLTAEERKEKRKQKMLKANMDARDRVRQAKAQQKLKEVFYLIYLIYFCPIFSNYK